MTEENWVKLPDPRPSMLPQDTLIILCAWCKGTLRWAVTDALVSEDNLGLVRYRGRAASNGEPDKTFVVASENISRVKLPPGYRFEGSEVVKDDLAIGVDPAVPGSDITGIQVVADKNVPKEWVYFSTPPRAGKSAFLRALEKQSAEMAAIYAQQGGLGLSDYVFRQGDYEPKLPAPACACGAVSNLRAVSLTGYRCGSCEQSRRRAELQAQKLEQTKRDMSRPVKRDPYEWLGFSSPSWEE